MYLPYTGDNGFSPDNTRMTSSATIIDVRIPASRVNPAIWGVNKIRGS